MKVSKAIFLLLIGIQSIPFKGYTSEIYVGNFGAVGDGIRDDGPAIRNALASFSGSSGSKTLVFGQDKKYYIKNIGETYLFDFKNQSDIILEGNNCIFLLDGAVRFLKAHNSENITLKNLSVDYKPLPFVEGKMISINQAGNYIDVLIDDYFDMPPMGGATKAPGEQSYFGLVWYNGPNSLLSSHFYFTDMQEINPGSNDRKVRLNAKDFNAWGTISLNDKISLPVRGIAHMGGDEVMQFVECRNVSVDHVNIWAAPWFAIGLTRNSGEVKFNQVNVMPKPNTNRILSSWRDGIHVKSNYARLIFDGCRLEGMGDDAFNIATFMSSVKSVINNNQIQIKQNYPLNIVPYKVGDMVVVYDIVQGKILGRSKVSWSTGFEQTGLPLAPTITINLENAIPEMNNKCVVWNESSANPNTLLTNCDIYKSCRFQSSVTIDNCDLIAFSWFWTTNVEGPIPSNVEVQNSRLFVGRGNDLIAASFTTNLSYNGTVYAPTVPPISNILLQNNEISGDLMLNYCKNVSIIDNRFTGTNYKIQLDRCENLLFRNNTVNNAKLESKNQINFKDYKSEVETDTEFANGTEISLMKPFAHWYGLAADGIFRYHFFPDELKPLVLRDKMILGKSYLCYQVNLPAVSEDFNRMCMEELPHKNSKTLNFWSYSDVANACKIKVVAKYPDHNIEELFSTVLPGHQILDYQVSIPQRLYDQKGVLQIQFSSVDNSGTPPPVFVGDINFSSLATSVGTTGFEKSFNITYDAIADHFRVIVPENKGLIEIFDLQGRKLGIKSINAGTTLISAGSYPRYPLIVRFKGDHLVYSQKIFKLN